jgi:tetratricopeptide (TPR) repeat protein
LLYEGDVAGYRDACLHMLERFGASAHLEDQLWLGQACSLGPGGLVDEARLLEKAEQCLALRPHDPRCQLVLGTLYFRAGRPDRAIPLLQNALADNIDGYNFLGWPVLVLACRQAGRADEARRWDEAMSRRVEQLARGIPVEPPEEDLNLPADTEWLLASLLRREARESSGGATTADQVLDWLVRSRGLVKLRRWDEAVAAYTRVMELHPAQGRFRLDRAHLYARLGRWRSAAADFDDAYRLGAADRVFDWYCYALCRLRMDDQEGYRRLCKEVLRRFGGRPRPKNALETLELQQVASICFLRPQTDLDLAVPTRLAKAALAVAPGDPILLLGSSAAHIRNGEPDKAIPQAHKALAGRWTQNMDWGGPAIVWLQLSIAHHQLGQPEEGRRWLEKAVQRIDGDPNARAAEESGVRWHLQSLLEIMRREAEELYGPKTASRVRGG